MPGPGPRGSSEEPARQPDRVQAAAYRLVQGQGDRVLVFPADEVEEADQVALGTPTLEGLIELAGSRHELAVLSLETTAGGRTRARAYDRADHGPPVRLVLQLERHRLEVSAEGIIVARPPLGPDDHRVIETWLDRARTVG